MLQPVVSPLHNSNMVQILSAVRWAIGQFFGPLALKIMNDNSPNVWLTPIYSQWGVIGLLFIIYALVPETPCESIISN